MMKDRKQNENKYIKKISYFYKIINLIKFNCIFKKATKI